MLENICSNYILKKVFSLVDLHKYVKLIKYNKRLQKNLDFNFQDSIVNYQYDILSKNQIKLYFEDMEYQLQDISKKNSYISKLSYRAKFCLKFSYPFPDNIDEEEDINTFLIKYKGFSIDEYPLPSIFIYMNFSDKIRAIENNEYFFKYTLNIQEIEIINLINELREDNNIDRLIYKKIQNLNEYFREWGKAKEKYLFINTIEEFKNKILEFDEDIIQKVVNKNIKCIMILKKGNKEYIFLYSPMEKIDLINFNLKKYKCYHLINNTIPEVKLPQHLIKQHNLCFTNLNNNLDKGINNEGYQILCLKNDILIGVLEGPPDTPYENGYFLFNIFFPEEYPFKPPQFCFITPILHPNVSENGYVSVNFLQNGWDLVHGQFEKIIYLIHVLLCNPNFDNYINERAIFLYTKESNLYDKIVKEYTSIFSNYSKCLEDINNLNIEVRQIEGPEFLNKE